MSETQQADQARGFGEYLGSEAATIGSYLFAFVRMVVVLNLVVGWTVFTGAVVRLHVIEGQLLKAGLLLVAFVLPGAVALLSFLRD